jgi:hypothetical protein
MSQQMDANSSQKRDMPSVSHSSHIGKKMVGLRGLATRLVGASLPKVKTGVVQCNTLNGGASNGTPHMLEVTSRS